MEGMVVLEAALCGRATVGTEVGILPELVPPDLAVPVGDDVALANALAALASQPAKLAAAGDMARLRALKDFSLATCVDRLLDIYEEAVALLRASR